MLTQMGSHNTRRSHPCKERVRTTQTLRERMQTSPVLVPRWALLPLKGWHLRRARSLILLRALTQTSASGARGWVSGGVESYCMCCFVSSNTF